MDNNKKNSINYQEVNFFDNEGQLFDQLKLEEFSDVFSFYKKNQSLNLFEIIERNDLYALDKALESGASPNQKNIEGYSLLDFAYIHRKTNAVEILRSYQAKLNLYRSESSDLLKQVIDTLEYDKQNFTVQVYRSSGRLQFCLTHSNSSGYPLSSFIINPWNMLETVKAEGKWKIFTKGDTCYILILKDEATTQPDLLCEISQSGTLKLQYANIPGASLQVSTEADFIFESIAAVKNLDIQANEIFFSENSKTFNGQSLSLKANQVNLHGTHAFKETEIHSKLNFIQSGDFVSELFSLNAEFAMLSGQIMASKMAKIDVVQQFNCDGSIVLGKLGNINAHVIDIARSAQIMVQQGEVRLNSTSKLENSGAIIGDQLFLSSGLMITNNNSALIKGLSTVLSAPQVNQGGFLITGQKSTLSYIDWGLSFAQAGVKIAELGAYITTPTAVSLKGYLLVSRTLHRAADIFYRAVNGEEINQSEIVTLILDNVIPYMKNISSHEEQARVLVNLLYQCYGSYQSEEAFVHKSLLAIETITRLISFGTAGTLDKENLHFLQIAAEYIKYSRIGLKTAEISLEAIHGISNNDIRALEHARASFATVAEMAIREYAYTLKPIKLFNSNIQLPARELAIYALNKGYSSDFFVENLVFAMLSAAKQEGLVTNEASLYIDTAIQGVLKAQHWQDLYQSYQEGHLSKRTITNEVINQLLFVLSNPTLRNQLTSKPTEPTEESKQIEETELKVEKAALDAEPQPEPESDSLSEEKASQNNIVNALIKEMKVLEGHLKEAKTPEERESIENQIQKVNDDLNENIKETIPERTIVDINIDPLTFVEPLLDRPKTTEIENIAHYDLLLTSLVQLQKAMNGEYATHGYLGAFAEAFHNDELIKTTGDIGIYSGELGTNSGQIQSTEGISLFGQDLHNRTLDNKIVSEKIAGLIHSQFTNFETGMLSAQEAISSFCVGLLENLGDIDSNKAVKVVAGRIVKNHETGSIIAKNDVDLLCDILSKNMGLISAENVTMEGLKQGATNSGKIYGLDKIRLISEKLASNTETGELVAPQVIFESQTVHKAGAISAALVDTKGYDSSTPDCTIWQKHDNDSVGALLLKSNKSDQIDSDAFSKVNLLDVTLPESFNGEFEFKVSSDFANILQLHYTQADKTIPVWSLPRMADDATLILDAPGHHLDCSNLTNTYNSHFRFTGNQVNYSGGNTSFNQTAFFAVDTMVGFGGKTQFYIQKGGFVQAEKMFNQGLFHSDGIMTWSLKNLNNDAVLENYMQYFFENKKAKKANILTSYEATRVMEDSGVIYAAGHRGHLGEFNQHGGAFLSGEQGNFVYHAGGNQRAILIHKGHQTADVIEDGGQNWHVMPEFYNAAVDSAGQNTLIGKEALIAAGLDFESETGTFLYTEQGLQKNTQSADYHIPETQSRTRRGKFQHTVHADERGQVISQNKISSQHGDVLIFAPEGGIELQKTIIDAGNSALVIAKNKVKMEGAENKTQSKDRQKRRKLWRYKKTTSDTSETKIERSYVFTNADLIICCEELELNSTFVDAKGDFNFLGKTATLDGKQQTFDNKTKTQEIRLSMPAIDNLQAILKGGHARTMFAHLLHSFGWNDEELKKILHAKSVGELPGPAVRFARDAFNLTSLVAASSNKLGKSPKDIIGTLTDKLGITTLNADGKRIPNPRFSLRITRTTEQTQASQCVATTIMVGGTFRVIGNTLHLLKGSAVDAEHLRIFLTEGIKATYGTEHRIYSKNTQSASLGVSALNPYDVDINLAVSKEYQYNETHHNAKLHARGTTEINAGKTIEGNLNIKGENGGAVSAPNMNFQSSQDVHIQKTLEASVSASTTGSSAGASFQKGKKEEYTTAEFAGIELKGGEVLVDQLHLEAGSKVETGQLHRADGEEGLPTVIGTEVIDSKIEQSKGFGVQLQPTKGLEGDPSGGVNYHSEKIETLHRPTVIADNVSEGELPGINTDESKQSEQITKKRKGLDLEGSKSEFDKLTEVGKQSLDYLFKPAIATSTSEPQQEPQTYSSLDSDNTYVQKALEAEHNNLFGQALNLDKEQKENVQPKHNESPTQSTKSSKPKNNQTDFNRNKTPDTQSMLSDYDVNLILTGNKSALNKQVGNLPAEIVNNLFNAERPSAPCLAADCEALSMMLKLNKKHDAFSTMYIAAERSVVSTGQGIKQLALNLGEKADLVEKGETAKYTKKINKEAEIYENSSVGQTKLAQATAFATDMAIGFVLPEVKAASFGRVGQAAVSGMFQGSLAPTEDGSLTSNAKNAAFGLVEGAAQGIATDKILKITNNAFKKPKTEKPLVAANDTFNPDLSLTLPSADMNVPANIYQQPKKPIVFSNQAKAIVKPIPKIKEDSTQNTKNTKTQASEKKPKK